MLRKCKRLYDQIITNSERKRKKKRKRYRPCLRHSKFMMCCCDKGWWAFNGNYIEYGKDGDTYFQHFSSQECLERMRKHFVDIIIELKSTKFSWKMYFNIRIWFWILQKR